MTNDGRQTVMREWSNPNVEGNRALAFPYHKSTRIIDDAPGEKTHLVNEGDLMDDEGTTGETYCGRWKVKVAPIETELQALQVAKNLCKLCLKRLEAHEKETLAAMANACSDHEITVESLES